MNQNSIKTTVSTGGSGGGLTSGVIEISQQNYTTKTIEYLRINNGKRRVTIGGIF